jgi:hypothetical protein
MAEKKDTTALELSKAFFQRMQDNADQAIYDEDTAALEARIKELEKEQLTPIEAQFLLADYGGCGCKVCKGLVSKLKSIAKGDTK